MIKAILGAAVLIGLCTILPFGAHADTSYSLTCPESTFKGTIAYSVIGLYRSIYKECNGKVIYDGTLGKVRSIEINISSASVESSCRWCDDIVRSKQVLDAKTYPHIIFKSNGIENTDGGLWLIGRFYLHGFSKMIRSRFDVKVQKENTLLINGTWKFNRKDFNVIWNTLLDHGGILVGDYITVDWSLKGHQH